MRRMKGVRIGLAVVLLALLSLGVFATTAYGAKKPAKWSRTKLTQTAHRGRSIKTTVIFKATSAVKGVKFSASGTGAKFVKISPSSVKKMRKGAKKTLTLTFKVPAKAKVKNYSASVAAKSKKKSLASNLKIAIRVYKLPVFKPGANSPLATAPMGSAGGTLVVPAGTNPISGVQVQIPPGALTGNVTVSVAHNSGKIVPRAGRYAGAVMVLDTGTIHDFTEAVTITVPWPDTSKIPCPYYVDDAGLLHPAQLVSLDAANHRFSFQTFHASWYTWIWESLADLTGYGTNSTGYSPAADGMKIVNRGSVFNRGGECFGMTSFSLWYFMTHKADGNFYPRFMNVLGQESDGTPITGQNVIATRSFISIAQQWNTYYSNLAWTQQGALTQAARYAAIVNAIQNTDKPVLIYLAHADRSAGAHSVLAYAYNTISGTLSIYDPNQPAKVNSIHYSLAAKTFSPYGGYDFITYSGDGSLRLQENYQHIYDDARANFAGSNKAQIDLTSPAATGSRVAGRNVTIAGHVHSGQVLVTKLRIFVGSTAYEVDVPISGTFSKTVSLEAGMNHLKFRTRGPQADGTLIDVPNNMDLADYTVQCDAGQSKMLVTLTWDTANTDLDLYVTDPTNNTSWYGHKVTTDGGTLDFDITSGYGPEHFTLLTSNTVRYNSPYAVKVHYYSDHLTGTTISTNYTVTIKLYEGTPREQTFWYRGNLSSDSSANDDPGSTGPDWATIANVTLTP